MINTFRFSFTGQKKLLLSTYLLTTAKWVMIFPRVPNILTGLGEDQNRSTTKNIDDIVYTKPRGKLKSKLSDFPAFAKYKTKFFLTLPWPWQNSIIFFSFSMRKLFLLTVQSTGISPDISLLCLIEHWHRLHWWLHVQHWLQLNLK